MAKRHLEKSVKTALEVNLQLSRKALGQKG